MHIIRVALLLTVAFLFIPGLSGCETDQSVETDTERHVFDEAGVMGRSEVTRFDWMLDLIEKESDLDIKFLFLPTIGNATIEEVAIEKMDVQKR